jgi:PAS domain S-box-containing protein
MTLQAAAFLDILHVLAVAVLGLVSVHAFRYRETAVGKPFCALIFVLMAWAGLTLLHGRFGRPAAPTQGMMIAGVLEQVAAVTVTPLWLLYVGRYTGRGQRLTRRMVAVLFAPVGLVITIGVLLSALTEPLSPVELGTVFVGFTILTIYGSGLYLVGIYLLARLTRQYRQLPYTQVLTLGAALAAPYLLLAVSSISEPTDSGGTAPILSVDITALGFLAAGLLLSYAMWRYPLFTAFPASEHVARDTVVEELDEAVLMLDDSDVILDLNTAAAALSAQPAEELLGQPIQSTFDGIGRVPKSGVERIELRTPDGPRQFEVSTSEISDGDDGLIGRTVLLRDVTERETREQQLEVLTRVLRHNLRNDLDTVLAYAEEVENPTTRERLRSNAKRLGETASKARAIEDVLSAPQESSVSVDVDEVARSVADRFRAEHPDCMITVEAPAELAIRSHRQLLDQLVTELVENAIQHTDQAAPAVEISVRFQTVESERVRVEIEVADNGPGIPEWEREIIRQEQESALKHGTGLGLWLVNWITTELNGELSFDTTNTGGSVVTVSIRATPVRTP